MTADDDPYRAPWWLPGGHLQTLVAPWLAPRRPAYDREFWEAPDGDFIDVDWAGPPDARKLLVLFHGLEGNSGSHHIRSLVSHALQQGGWRCAVPHFRGCSGRPNRLPRAYHAADGDEIDWILRRLRQDAPDVEIFAAGVSLGGCALMRWLSDPGRQSEKVIARAATISAPLDLGSMSASLSRGFSRIYGWYFLFVAGLRRKALAKLVRFPREWWALGLHPASIRQAHSLAAFDEAVTAPLHGFERAADYWRHASQTSETLSGIRVPTLLLHAGNDPFLPASRLPRPKGEESCVTQDFPSQGGHAGFPGANRWMARRVLRFLSQ